MILYFLKIHSLRNNLSFLRKKHPARLLGYIIFTFFLLLGTYLGIKEGLEFILSLGGLAAFIIKKIIFVLFSIIFFMVAISMGVLFYGVGFKSKETEFLLKLPLKRGKIIFYKFLESLIICSWIPLIGIFIFLLCYFQSVDKGLIIPFLSLLYILPFLIISCFSGFFLFLIIIRFFNLKKFTFFFFAILAGILIFISYYQPAPGGTFYFISEDVFLLNFSKLWFMPFSWIGYGLISLENLNFKEAFLYLINLGSLSLFLLSCLPLSERLFMDIYRSQLFTSSKKIISKRWLDNLFFKIKFSPPLKAFILKDIKLFTREPAMWFQFLVFFGILFFYFINLRRFSYHLMGAVWKNILTFLNMFALMSIVSAFGVRIIFPQWSLEGRNFWIIKLAPLSLRRIFWGKFIISFFSLLIISELLIFLSNYMLKLDKDFFIFTLIVVSVSSLTITALSSGLGAYFANLKQEYHLKAVESFGGLITLIANFGYVYLTVIIFGLLSHLYFKGTESILIKESLKDTIILPLKIWVIMSVGISMFVNQLGLRRLEVKEY